MSSDELLGVTDFRDVEAELDELSAADKLRIEVDAGLEEALVELENLRGQLSQNETATLVELCKNTVIDTITGQFGLASLFIDARDGGSSTTPHNFAKGYTANEEDHKKLAGLQVSNDNLGEVRKSAGYDAKLAKLRKHEFKRREVIVDAYTGKPLPKDERTHYDHVVPVKEIEQNPASHLYLSSEQRVEMASNEKNLAFTDSRINLSKGKDSLPEFMAKKNERTGLTEAQKYGIDEKKASARDREARRYIKKEITVEAVKKHSRELLATGGKDALMMAAYSSIGVVLRDFAQTIFVEIHITLQERGKETFGAILRRFRQSLAKKLEELKGKWKDLLWSSVGSAATAFFSNLLVFVINLVATTLKKIVSLIRAGFVSLVQALKVMINPPAGISKEDAGFEAVKILTAGLIGAASLGLSAAIEALLLKIPGLQPLMMFPIPFPGKEQRTVSDVIAVTLAALAGGVLTTIVLYFMDKCREANRKERLRFQLVAQSGVVVQYKLTQTWLFLDEAYRALSNIAADFAFYLTHEQQLVLESGERADQSIAGLRDANERLKSILKREVN